MSEEEWFEESERESPSTDALAAQVDSLRSQLEDVYQRMATRDQVVSASLAQLREPVEYVEPNAPEIVATTPSRPRPPLPTVSPQMTQAVTRQALATAAASIPEWDSVSDEVMSRIQDNPQRFGELVQRGDSLTVSQYLANIAQSEQARADTRAMKLAAMSATGASGRTPAPPDDDWREVMNFARGEKKYWT